MNRFLVLCILSDSDVVRDPSLCLQCKNGLKAFTRTDSQDPTRRSDQKLNTNVRTRCTRKTDRFGDARVWAGNARGVIFILLSNNQTTLSFAPRGESEELAGLYHNIIMWLQRVVNTCTRNYYRYGAYFKQSLFFPLFFPKK